MGQIVALFLFKVFIQFHLNYCGIVVDIHLSTLLTVQYSEVTQMHQVKWYDADEWFPSSLTGLTDVLDFFRS